MIAEHSQARPRPAEFADLDERSASVFLVAAREHPKPFLLSRPLVGLELALGSSEGAAAGRAFLKVCSVRPGHTLVFFYKRSLLPFRRDRLSYGGCEWRDEDLRPEHAQSSLDFLASGLSPEARPSWLRRSLPWTVPE